MFIACTGTRFHSSCAVSTADTAPSTPDISPGNTHVITAARATQPHRWRSAIPLLGTALAIFCIGYIGRQLAVDAAASPATKPQSADQASAEYTTAIRTADTVAAVFGINTQCFIDVKERIGAILSALQQHKVELPKLCTPGQGPSDLAVMLVYDSLNEIIKNLKGAIRSFQGLQAQSSLERITADLVIVPSYQQILGCTGIEYEIKWLQGSYSRCKDAVRKTSEALIKNIRDVVNMLYETIKSSVAKIHSYYPGYLQRVDNMLSMLTQAPPEARKKLLTIIAEAPSGALKRLLDITAQMSSDTLKKLLNVFAKMSATKLKELLSAIAQEKSVGKIKKWLNDIIVSVYSDARKTRLKNEL